jgi:hypothetical protein
MHPRVVFSANALSQLAVAATYRQHLNIERRTGQRRRVFPQGFGPIAAAGQ